MIIHPLGLAKKVTLAWDHFIEKMISVFRTDYSPNEPILIKVSHLVHLKKSCKKTLKSLFEAFATFSTMFFELSVKKKHH